MSLYPKVYNPGPIEPVVEPGQNVLLQEQSGGYSLYTVAFVEPLPLSGALSVNLNGTSPAGAALGAGASTPVMNPTNQIDMNNGDLAQFRFFVMDPVTVILSQPRALPRNMTHSVEAVHSPWSRIKDPYDALTETWVWENQRFFLQATNIHNFPIQLARIGIYGFRYVLSGTGGTDRPQGGDLPPKQNFPSIEAAIAAQKSGQAPAFKVIPIGGWAS